MFTKLLTALLLLFTFLVAGLCNVNIPEHENYVLVKTNDGTVHNISLFDTLNNDEHFNWSEPINYNDEDYSLNRTLNHVNPSLYTHADPHAPYVLTPETALNAPFQINLPTVVLVHGWLETWDIYWVLHMKDKYFINGKYNIIIVEWAHYATMPYKFAANWTRKVGQYIGDILVLLIDGGKIFARDIHIVGHSLGAHVAGYMGKIVKARAQKDEKIGRITGLDPARIFFENPPVLSERRLVKEDATFVDVIHTCSGVLGFRQSIGHVDFWPNSGFPPMTGCKGETSDICSHSRSYEYYTESINMKNFVAYQCTSWAEYERNFCAKNDQQPMGLYTNSSARGDYYLSTNADPPYAQG